MSNTNWVLENYTVYGEGDILRVKDNNGDLLGYVSNSDPNLVVELAKEANPIEERWEDGIGNTIHMNGW